MINYEFPLNEKIRRFLRIEEIFSKIDYQQKSRQNFSEYVIFTLLFDLMTTASRSDLKVELLHTLDATQIKLKNKRKSAKNNELIKKIFSAKKNLEKTVIQPGFYFEEHPKTVSQQSFPFLSHGPIQIPAVILPPL